MRGMGDDSAGMYHRQRIENKSFYDYRANLGIHLQNRLYVRDFRDQIGVQPSNSFLYMTAPPNEAQNPANAFTTVLARNGVLHSKNTAINALAWSNRAHLDIATFTHQAHFLLAGNDTGQIVQWNGQTLNWEPPLVPAHTEAIRDIRFSHDSQNLLTCGKSGVVKYVLVALLQLSLDTLFARVVTKFRRDRGQYVQIVMKTTTNNNCRLLPQVFRSALQRGQINCCTSQCKRRIPFFLSWRC